MPREKLKPKESAFVKNILSGMAKAEAALAAGYAPGSARVSAYQLMQRERVQNALREGAEAKLKCGVAIAAAVLIELAEKSKSDDVRLRASQAILDRGGLQLIRQSEHHHVVTDRRSDAELRAHAIALAAQLAIPLPAGIIDVPFEPITLPSLPAPPPEPVASPPVAVNPFEGCD